MKGMIFAAGLGTRLRPLTDTTPKALIKVGGRPMIDHVISRMHNAGIGRIVVNVHHHADILKSYLSEHYGDTVIISDESDELLDTGGALVKALPYLGGNEPVLVYNADIFTDFSIREMLCHHMTTDGTATLLVAERETSRYFLFDDEMRMRGWRNISTGESKSPAPLSGSEKMLAFGGVHIMKPSFIERMRAEVGQKRFSITPYYIDVCGDEKLIGFVPSAPFTWIDIGRPESLARAREIAGFTQF